MFKHPSIVYCYISFAFIATLGFLLLQNADSMLELVQVATIFILFYVLDIAIVIINYMWECHKEVMAKLDKFDIQPRR